MTPRYPRSATPPVVLVFGESINDSASIAELIVAANPTLAGLVRARPRPTSLTRDAKADSVRRWVDELHKAVQAAEAAGTRIRAVVVHRDGDGPDPAGKIETTLATQLATVSGRPVVPVQAMEAWWFLYPDSVESVRPRAWSDKLPRTHRDVEAISKPKTELERLTRKGGAAEYSEADSVAIAQHIRAASPKKYGSSASFDRFTTMVGLL